MKTLFKFRIAIVVFIVVIFVCLDMYKNRDVQFIRKPYHLSKEEIDSRVNEYFNRHMLQTSKSISPEFKKRKDVREKKKQELLKKAYENERRDEQENILQEIEALIIEDFKESE